MSGGTGFRRAQAWGMVGATGQKGQAVRKLMLSAALLLAGCTEWPEPLRGGPQEAAAPQLQPIDAFAPRIGDPGATAAELAARSAALEARAAALRDAEP